jgi:4-carboxymuconolactone decarboxylase
MSKPSTAALAAHAGLDPKLSADALSAHAKTYTDLLGFVPHRVESRMLFTGAMDREMVELQEKMRSRAMDTKDLDPKMVQLIIFGMLLMDGNDAAETHAVASRKEGASWQELQAVINLCFLFRGLPAANRGADLIARVVARELPAESAGA